MRDVTVARRYARALYQIASEHNGLDDVLVALGNLCHAMSDSADMKRLMLNPLVKMELKQKLVSAVSSNKLLQKFTALLGRRKRLDLIAAIYDQLLSMSDRQQGLHRALIKTAITLSDEQKKVIEERLAHRMGGKILGKFEVAKDLIGGVWIKMGDKVLDATLKGRIETFRHQLLHSTN